MIVLSPGTLRFNILYQIVSANVIHLLWCQPFWLVCKVFVRKVFVFQFIKTEITWFQNFSWNYKHVNFTDNALLVDMNFKSSFDFRITILYPYSLRFRAMLISFLFSYLQKVTTYEFPSIELQALSMVREFMSFYYPILAFIQPKHHH